MGAIGMTAEVVVVVVVVVLLVIGIFKTFYF